MHIAGLIFVALWIMAMFTLGVCSVIRPARTLDWYERNLVWVPLWKGRLSDDPFVVGYARIGGIFVCAFCVLCLFLVIRAMVLGIG